MFCAFYWQFFCCISAKSYLGKKRKRVRSVRDSDSNDSHFVSARHLIERAGEMGDGYKFSFYMVVWEYNGRLFLFVPTRQEHEP